MLFVHIIWISVDQRGSKERLKSRSSLVYPTEHIHLRRGVLFLALEGELGAR